MNIDIRNRKRPPPPPAHFLIKNVLFCFLLIVFLAIPVQSQSPTSTPSANAKLVNPSESPWISDCGLPLRWSEFDSSAAHRTFEMTSDCVFPAGPHEALPRLQFIYNSGAFTINGNGYSIIGPPNRTFLVVGGAHPTGSGGDHPAGEAPTVTLNLNDVTIRGTGGINGRTTVIVRGARFNATNVTFRDNVGQTILSVRDSGKAHLTNVQFLNNRKTYGEAHWGSTIFVRDDNVASINDLSDTRVEINGGVFERNAGSPWAVVSGYQANLTLAGSIIFKNNAATTIREAVPVHSDYRIFEPWTGLTTYQGVVDTSAATITSIFNLVPWRPKKKEEPPTPAPTSTPRPQIAATHVALQAATGATFSAAFGLDSGVHFRQLDGAGIGVQSIIDAGFLEAFDVYGYVEQGVDVCFPQIGRVVFLDANTSPRAIVPLPATIVNGQTCVSINSPGSLVLLPQ